MLILKKIKSIDSLISLSMCLSVFIHVALGRFSFYESVWFLIETNVFCLKLSWFYQNNWKMEVNSIYLHLVIMWFFSAPLMELWNSYWLVIIICYSCKLLSKWLTLILQEKLLHVRGISTKGHHYSQIVLHVDSFSWDPAWWQQGKMEVNPSFWTHG